MIKPENKIDSFNSIYPLVVLGGDYRSRTGDLLHAMQTL